MHRRACCAVLFAASCFAYSYYPPRLPNGEKIQRSYGSFGHVGFKSSGTAGNARPNINAFGDSFDMVGNIWTEEFCLSDADGDGFSNGFEMGDPCCIWEQGGQKSPMFQVDLSNPADAASVPLTRKCTAVSCPNGVNACNATMRLSSSHPRPALTIAGWAAVAGAAAVLVVGWT